MGAPPGIASLDWHSVSGSCRVRPGVARCPLLPGVGPGASASFRSTLLDQCPRALSTCGTRLCSACANIGHRLTVGPSPGWGVSSRSPALRQISNLRPASA